MFGRKAVVKLWAAISVSLAVAYGLSFYLKTGEIFFLIINSINTLLVLGAVLFRKTIDKVVERLGDSLKEMIETTQSAYIELHYANEIVIGLFFIVTATLAGVYIVVFSIWDTQSYLALIKEDGLVEYASVLFWLLAAVILLYQIVRSSRKELTCGYQRLFYILILLFFVFAAGEEISWGQRIFDLKTPEFLKKINVQNELTVHNIGSISIFSNAFFLLTVVFFLGLPYVRSKNTSIRKIIDYYSLPFPNRFAVGTYLITLSVWIFVGIRFGTLGFHPFSFYAENYYTQMDDEIFECLAAYSFLCFSALNSVKSTSIRNL